MTKKIKQSINLVVAMLVIFNLIGVSITHAYFSDVGISEDNEFSAGVFNFSLSDTEDFSPNFDKVNPAIRTMTIDNEGTLGFQYRVSAINLDGLLCAGVNIEASFEGDIKYNGALSAFIPISAVTHSGGADEWTFTMTAGYDVSIVNDPCQFELNFEGWQENIANYGDNGFSNKESMLTHLMFREEATGTEIGIVLNEVLANPLGIDSELAGAYGEWIEIYNNGTSAVDLAGWKISEISGTTEREYTITATTISPTEVRTYGGSTIIDSHGWLVILMDGARLNNDGDIVSLHNDSEILMDSYSYTFATENKSDARYPDGIGGWVDPVPTMGQPNILTGQELIDLGLMEQDENLKVSENAVLIPSIESSVIDIDEDEFIEDNEDLEQISDEEDDSEGFIEEAIEEIILAEQGVGLIEGELVIESIEASVLFQESQEDSQEIINELTDKDDEITI